MKPKNLSEVSSQDEFLEYLIDNYYRLLGEGGKFDKFVSWSNTGEGHVLTVTSNCKFVTLEEQEGSIVTKWIVTLDAYKDKIKTLRNKPSFEDHPDAKCFVQCDNGSWFKNIETCNVAALDEKQWVTKGELFGWVHIQSGKVIGDWKQTFEKAPEKKETTVCKKDAIIEQLVAKGIHNYLDSLVKDAFAINRGRQQQKYIKELEQENQELKTKIDHIKQSLY